MKRVVAFCLATLMWPMAFANNSAQQRSRMESQATAAGNVLKNLNTSAQTGQAYSARSIQAEIFMANSAEFGGNTERSIDEWQVIYNKALLNVSRSAGRNGRITWIRMGSEAGYNLAWYRLDQRDDEAATAILNQLSEWLRPFDRQNVIPQMRLPLARLLWVQARVALEKGDRAEDARLKARVLALTANPKVYLEDYGSLAKMRIVAHWYDVDDKRQTGGYEEACRIVHELDALVPGVMTKKLIECDINVARRHLAAKRLDDARTALENARKKFLAVDQRNKEMLELKMVLIDVENVAAEVARQDNDLATEARIQVAAARSLAKSLAGITLLQTETNQIKTLYDGFKNVAENAKVLPEYDTNEKLLRLQTELFGKLAESIEPSRRVFKKSPFFAAVTADAATKAANAYNRLDSFEQGLAFGQRAIVAIDEAGLLAQLHEFSEDGATVCQAYARKLESLIGLRRADNAVSAYVVLREECGGWLRKYPWDFYARQYLPSSANKLGLLLADEKRFAEARPVLSYASDWGVKDASARLAELYRESRGGAADPDRAANLDKLAERQSMKRFTVPTDFAGVKYPFHVYVQQYGSDKRCPADRSLKPDEEDCVGTEGIDDQAQWVKIARGGTVPDEAILAFRKLDKIARDHNVSFPDLTLYAMAENQKADEVKESAHEKEEVKNNEGPAGAIQWDVAKSDKNGAGDPQSVFFSVERHNGERVVKPATQISRKGQANCFGWLIRTPKEDREIEVREDYMLPGPPSEPHGVSSASTVMDGGRKIVTKLNLSAKEGLLSNTWCASAGDPLGFYRLEVHVGNEPPRVFTFELME